MATSRITPLPFNREPAAPVAEPAPPGNGGVPEASSAPAEVDAGAPAPNRDPSFGADIPAPAPVQEQRLINPEGLTRQYDEAERRIRRQVTQQIERGVRIKPPVNVAALEQGGYTTTSGSRVGYDLKRFAGQNPQGGSLGRNPDGNTTARGGGRAPTLSQATRMGGPVDPSGGALLDQYTSIPGVGGAAARPSSRSSAANPASLLDEATRISRSRAF